MDTSPRIALLTEQELRQVLTETAALAAETMLASTRSERGLKASEVAHRLACAESTVYGLIERGSLPAIRLGSALRVLESALDDWLRRQARSAVE